MDEDTNTGGMAVAERTKPLIEKLYDRLTAALNRGGFVMVEPGVRKRDIAGRSITATDLGDATYKFDIDLGHVTYTLTRSLPNGQTHVFTYSWEGAKPDDEDIFEIRMLIE